MKIFKVKDVKTPRRGTKQSAGLDFFVPNDFIPVVVFPHKDINIPSGIHVNVPTGKALVAFNKSGVATKKKLQVGACVVDEDYEGEVHLHLTNLSDSPITIEPGDKIVQFLLLDVAYDDIEESTSLAELYAGQSSERGAGGFGSTGTK